MEFDARKRISKQSPTGEFGVNGGSDAAVKAALSLLNKQGWQPRDGVARYSISLVSGFFVKTRPSPVGVCVFPFAVVDFRNKIQSGLGRRSVFARELRLNRGRVENRTHAPLTEWIKLGMDYFTRSLDIIRVFSLPRDGSFGNDSSK